MPKAVRAIDEVLEDYLENPYQSAFSVHPTQQKLIAHILSLVPSALGFVRTCLAFQEKQNTTLAERSRSHNTPATLRLRSGFGCRSMAANVIDAKHVLRPTSRAADRVCAHT